jgi:hypothetical protein
MRFRVIRKSGRNAENTESRRGECGEKQAYSTFFWLSNHPEITYWATVIEDRYETNATRRDL